MKIRLACQNCGAKKEFSTYIDGDGNLVMLANFEKHCGLKEPDNFRGVYAPHIDPLEDWHDDPETYRAVKAEWERKNREAGE